MFGQWREVARYLDPNPPPGWCRCDRRSSNFGVCTSCFRMVAHIVRKERSVPTFIPGHQKGIP